MREFLGERGKVDYQVLRDNSRWPDHVARSYVTGGLLAWLKPDTVLDPACGDASVVRVALRQWPFRPTLGDIGKANIRAVMGYVNGDADYVVGDALELIRGIGKVDVVVLTEFLEHVKDPDEYLRASLDAATWLIASSPEMRPGQRDRNPEHLWMFDEVGYQEMLEGAGWKVEQRTLLAFRSDYDFGVWVCRHA